MEVAVISKLPETMTRTMKMSKGSQAEVKLSLVALSAFLLLLFVTLAF